MHEGHSSATLADECCTHRGSAHDSSLRTDSRGKGSRVDALGTSLCDRQKQSLAAASAEGEAGLRAGGVASSYWALGAWGAACLQGTGYYTRCH